MTTQESFWLDDQEFGEVYYALVAESLNICPISWRSDLGASNSKLHHFFQSVFGDNCSSEDLSKYKKRKFRNDLATRKDEFPEVLSNWFDKVRKQYSNPAVSPIKGDKIALVWNRRKKDPNGRNSTDESLRQLVKVCKKNGYTPVLVGDKVEEPKKLGFDFDLSNFHGNYKLNHIQQIAYLLKLIDGRPAFSIGLQSGGMDGLALFGGIPTIFLSKKKTASNGMSALAKRIPNVFCWCEIQYNGQFEKFDDKVLQAVDKKIHDY
jgi:hypothetical protein